MYGKLICAVFFILVLGLASSASAKLIGYWKLDENIGANTADSSGYGNDGIIKY